MFDIGAVCLWPRDKVKGIPIRHTEMENPLSKSWVWSWILKKIEVVASREPMAIDNDSLEY